MRVVKHSTDGPRDLIDVIAGEILNKETSLYYWHDGVKTSIDGTGHTITKDEYLGYPKIVIGNIKQSVKVAFGIIFVTGFTPGDDFCKMLLEAVIRKEAQMPGIEPLEKYHTRIATYHTNLKVKSELKISTTSLTKGGNVKRLITADESDLRYSRTDVRFAWYVQHIRMFNPQLSRENPDISIANYVSSILYDDGDLTDLQHNDVLTNYSQARLKATPRIIETRGVIRINRSIPSIMLLLYGVYNIGGFYTIPVNVYSAELKDISPVPVKTDEDGIFSTEHCTGCRKLLYDDVYAFVDKGDDTVIHCHMYCPLCAHGKTALHSIGELYSHVLRVTWPRTIKDMIAQYIYEELRDALVSIVDHGYIEVTGEIPYVLIGDDYLGVYDLNKYKFSQLVNDDSLAHRRVVVVSVSG